MDRSAHVCNLSASLLDAIDRTEWDTAARIRERLMSLLIEAAADDEPNAIEKIRDGLSAAYSRLVYGKGANPRWTIDIEAAMVKAEAACADIARRSRPPERFLHKDSRSVRDAILMRLEQATEPLNNSQIAADLSRPEETVSRELAQLRKEGLIRSWKGGRYKFNTLTERGKRAAAKLSGQPTRPDATRRQSASIYARSADDFPPEPRRPLFKENLTTISSKRSDIQPIETASKEFLPILAPTSNVHIDKNNIHIPANLSFLVLTFTAPRIRKSYL